MDDLRNCPLLVFVLSLVGCWLSAYAGGFFHQHFLPSDEQEYSDLGMVVAATLTLLGLLIGFSFSMAISRYDQRKNYEAEEANAIGTEYVRLSLLPGEQSSKSQQLLIKYLHQRILFYENRGRREDLLQRMTAQLEGEMWSVVATAAAKQPTPPMILVVSGMNDVLNARSYTQASWWNRIPMAAWALMAAIAIFCNVLIGYSAHRKRALLFVVLPLALSISFSLVADIDSPRGGVIRVLPQNLVSLADSLNSGK